MARNRASARLQSGWNAWAAGSSRATEIERLELELEESRARERHAPHETAETRERFERLLDASRRFTHTLSERRRHQQTSRRYLSVQHTIDSVLLEADGLEDAAAGVLQALGENLGWQVTVLWVVGEETLRCLEIWHGPNAVPDGFEAACLRTRCVRGEGLPGIAWAENRPVWAGELPQEGGSVGRPIRLRVGCGASSPFPLPGVVDHKGSSSSWAARSCTRTKNCSTPSASSDAGSASSSTAGGARRSCTRLRSGSGWLPRPGTWACWIGTCLPTRIGALARWPRYSATLRVSSNPLTGVFWKGSTPTTAGACGARWMLPSPRAHRTSWNSESSDRPATSAGSTPRAGFTGTREAHPRAC